MIYTVLLNPTIDHILKINNFKAGETFKASEADLIPLGKGLSVAYAVASLGERVTTIGFMSRHDEPFYNQFLSANDVEHDWVLHTGHVRHNITILDTKKESVTHLREPGYRITPDMITGLYKRLSKRVRAGDWVAFCGSLPPGAPVRTFRDAIAFCREKRANVMLDTSGKALIEGIRGKPFGIKPNQKEFEEIFDEKINGIQHIALKAKGLIDRGIQHVFVSLGEDGLLAANSTTLLSARVTVARPFNTVGCGDSLLAGILVGLQRGLSFEKVCSLGVACGAANTIGFGPGIFRKTDVDKFLARVEIAVK